MKLQILYTTADIQACTYILLYCMHAYNTPSISTEYNVYTNLLHTILQSCSPLLPPLQADVYVNTAHQKLDLNHGAVAQSLLRSGGPALQAECNQYIVQHGSVPVWSYATTGGGNLRCKHVIHAVGTNYDGPGGSAEKVCGLHCH